MDAKGSFNWRYLLGLAKLVRREGVDLIQSHLLGSNVYCSLAGLLVHKPVVATFHGTVDIGADERLKNLKFAAINAGAQRIVAVSDSLRADIVNRTPLKPGKTGVIYNGIRVADFQRGRCDTLRRQFGWSEDDVIIGSLGNIRSAKGYDILLRAAALLKRKAPVFRFVIAGQGKTDLYHKLLGLRDELGLNDRVHFLGFMDDPAGFLSNLDLFLLTSTSEGFSIATIQAMASRLPVIATRSGGPEEIITHARTGWLVDAGDPAVIAEAVGTLASDRELCARLSEAGRQYAVETFDVRAMLGEYGRIYDALLH
jgi:glycosyltransferase involved in cell wall biosynthesis